MKLSEAYASAYSDEFQRLMEAFLPGAVVTQRRKRGSGTTGPSVSASGTAKATANYGAENTVDRPPEGPTPPQAKIKKYAVKRWEGGIARKKRPIAPVARYTGKRAKVGGKV